MQCAVLFRIEGLIHDSVRKVERGASLVDRSSLTLAEIVASTKRVSDLVAEIAAASREQTVSLEHVAVQALVGRFVLSASPAHATTDRRPIT